MQQHIIGDAATFLKPYQMTQVTVGDTQVVIARTRGGTYHALGAHCPHAGAPLEQGLLQGDTVMCAWHHACFDVRSGARTHPPAITNIPRYPLTVNDDGQLVLTLAPDDSARPFDNTGSNTMTVVVVGGGAAGHAAIEELRRSGFRGRLVLLTAEPHNPLDRTELSKGYLQGAVSGTEALRLRGDDWYSFHDVERVLGVNVTRLNLAEGVVYFTGAMQREQPLAYDRLLLATGSVPRTLPDVPRHLENVFVLRTVQDAAAIVEAAQAGQRVAVLGASFIGMEAAASLRAHGLDVTVITPEDAPFAGTFGGRVGAMIQAHHERENDITFIVGKRVKGIAMQGGRAVGVDMEDWTTIAADFVVMGVGVQPNTGFLRGSNLNMGDDGSLIVDKHLQTNSPGVYAAGDIARYENRRGMSERVEHWRVAQQHGVLVAHNIMGAEESVDDLVPFFWTQQHGGLQIQYVGHAARWEQIIYRGDVEAQDFIAFYIENERLRAAAGMKRARELCAVEFIVRDRLPLKPEQMADENFDLIRYAQTGLARLAMG